jgi:hypothetical protein
MVHYGISVHFQNTSCATNVIPIHGYLRHLGFDFRHIASIGIISQKALPAGVAAIPLSAVSVSAMSFNLFNLIATRTFDCLKYHEAILQILHF